jgi:hypothetical protein
MRVFYRGTGTDLNEGKLTDEPKQICSPLSLSLAAVRVRPKLENFIYPQTGSFNSPSAMPDPIESGLQKVSYATFVAMEPDAQTQDIDLTPSQIRVMTSQSTNK